MPADDPWHLIVQPLPDVAVPPDVRVRRWLKAGLRGYGLRVVFAGSRFPGGPEAGGGGDRRS